MYVVEHFQEIEFHKLAWANINMLFIQKFLKCAVLFYPWFDLLHGIFPGITEYNEQMVSEWKERNCLLNVNAVTQLQLNRSVKQ